MLKNQEKNIQLYVENNSKVFWLTTYTFWNLGFVIIATFKMSNFVKPSFVQTFTWNQICELSDFRCTTSIVLSQMLQNESRVEPQYLWILTCQIDWLKQFLSKIWKDDSHVYIITTLPAAAFEELNIKPKAECLYVNTDFCEFFLCSFLNIHF